MSEHVQTLPPCLHMLLSGHGTNSWTCTEMQKQFTLSQKTPPHLKKTPSSHICPLPNSFHPGLKFFDNFSHSRRIIDIVTSQDFGPTRQHVYAGGKGLRLEGGGCRSLHRNWSGLWHCGCSVVRWNNVNIFSNILLNYVLKLVNKYYQILGTYPASHSKGGPFSWSIVEDKTKAKHDEGMLKLSCQIQFLKHA